MGDRHRGLCIADHRFLGRDVDRLVDVRGPLVGLRNDDALLGVRDGHLSGPRVDVALVLTAPPASRLRQQ